MEEKLDNCKDKFSTKQKLPIEINEFSLENGLIAKRIEELIIANKELAFQNEEKEKRVAELIIANKELTSLNTEQQNLFGSIVNSSEDAILSKTHDGIITSWNYGAEKIFGYQPNEIIGKPVFVLIPKHLHCEEVEIANKIKNGETVQHYETERVKKDGTIFNVSLSISPIRDWKGTITGASKILRDITLNRIAEEKLIKSNRMYAFISAINQMIVKTTDETSLYNQACSIAVAIGKFKMAWIGMIDEATKMVIPLVHAGEEDDYLVAMMPISIEDIPQGRGATGKSLRQGEYIVCNDIENDPCMLPWKETAAERGYLSCIAYPLKKFGKVVGSYSLYAPVKDFFDDAEIALLDEAAGDISYALESLEKTALHKKTEGKLNENYTLLHITGEIAKVGGWYVNLDEDCSYWSDEVAAIHEMPAGYAPLVQEGMNFYTPEWHNKIREVFTKCAKNGISYDEDMEIFTASGKRVWVRTIGEAVRDNNGKIVKVQGAFQDISERKVMEAALMESEKEVRAIAESMPQIVWVTNADGDNIYFNRQWIEYTGLTLEQSYGDGWLIPFHKEDKPIAWRAWNKAIVNKEEYNVECRLRRHDGIYRWWLLRGVPKINEKGEILKWYGSCTDIENIKQAEIEHAKIIDDLIHHNQNLEQFTYIVSHNLRAPVANIKGLADILGDESLSKEESASVVKGLLSTVNKLDTVILDLNNILQLKRNASETKERVVFSELVNGIEESIRSLVLRENVAIVAQFDEVPEMISLKSYLYSIFYNLISNSIKYRRPDICPVIEIKSIRREDKIELIFKDNGRGIDLKKSGHHIFGLYKRFHWDVEGKGVGLFTVKTQVEALGGKISIESEVDKGTAFKILFSIDKKV
jgi:PAS domain S-box-containing protein